MNSVVLKWSRSQLTYQHLTAASQRCWDRVGFAFADPQSKEAEDIRETMTSLILDLAAKGERDPIILSDYALANLPPAVSDWLRIE